VCSSDLTLLTTDYKILAKAIAMRLQKVLSGIINNDQSGCIQGRSTFDNIRSTLDIIEFTDNYNMPGLLAYIDYEKAFDTVKWDFMYDCLEAMNFGKFFIECVRTLYSNIHSAIINNGHLSEFFKPNRGIRQGCPLSANLFVIIVEILANAIRNNNRIEGIKILNKEFKISQFADDTCFYLKDQESLKTVLLVLDIFTKCAGLKMNRDKSEAIWIGSSSNFLHKPYELNWTNKTIKSLGIYIGLDRKKMIQENFNLRLKKIESLLKTWGLRKMTIKGKIIIVNTLILPQLLYFCTVMYTPNWVIEQYNSLISQFIWNQKPPKVKNSTLINTIECGGLKLQELEAKIKSLKLKWISKMLQETDNVPWKTYLESYFK
jgi:hypothetical protein